MRISDWSSDVCSSDLPQLVEGIEGAAGAQAYEKVAGTDPAGIDGSIGIGQRRGDLVGGDAQCGQLRLIDLHQNALFLYRSEARRVGKEGVSKCRSRWSRSH